MKALREFIKTTIVGGIVFLVPMVLLLVVLRHAMALAGRVGAPIAAHYPEHRIAGVAVATIIAALLLVLLSFLAGLFARTAVGRKLAQWLEDSLFGKLPQYRLVKTMAEGLAHVEDARALRPALVSVNDGWQLGYVLERVRAGWVAVFLPQAPMPMSGNVLYLPDERVRPLDIPFGEAVMLIRHLGVGSAHSLRTADLSPVREN